MGKHYVSDKFLANRYEVDRSTIWRWCAKEQFPKPQKLTPGCSRWDLEEVEAWESLDRKEEYSESKKVAIGK